MAKKMLIDATHPEETRVVVVDGQRVDDFDFESINKRQLAGNIYLAKVIRVEPSLQAAFVDYGGNRHGFLAFSEIHPDYYQIPAADRAALLAAEAEQEVSEEEDEERPAKPRSKTRARGGAKRKPRGKAAKAAESADSPADDGPGDAAAEAPAAEAPSAAEIAEADAPAQGDAAQARDPDKAASEAPEPDAAAPDGEDGVDGDERAETRDDPPKRPIAEAAGVGEGETVSEDYAEPEAEAADPAEAKGETESGDAASKPKARRRRARRKPDAEGDAAAESAEEDAAPESVAAEAVEDEVRPRRIRARHYKIQEVIKPRQIVLVQVVKEERGNKGAALTTYLSLAGRYCVLMPNTARGGGISRKITNATDRKKLKDIAGELSVPTGMGLIIRTAGAQRTRTEIKRDYEFLLRQWEQVRELTLKSIAPTPIYEEGSLIKRSIRDLYSKEIDEVLVGGEDGYREAKDYMRMLMPSHAKNVQPYRDTVPLFSRFQVENYLAAMFNPTVQLKSGGYIVIGITEALVAIDVNSGRSTREGSIEETALKTNLEAAEEVARQLRLRDLAGLIVIDFIDMDERRNNAAVERRLKDKLKNDRARIQLGRISAFGLLEMSRQRLRPGMLEASTAACPHCHGTGSIRSEESLALSILRDIEDEGVRGRSSEVQVTAPIAIANFLFNRKREHMGAIEGRYGLRIAIEGDPSLISPDYKVEKVKGAPPPRRPAAAAVSAETAFAEDAEEVEETEATPPADPKPREAAAREENGVQGEDERGKNRRRRGRRGGRKRKRGEDETGDQGDPMPVIDAAESDEDSAKEGENAAPMTVARGPFGEEIGVERPTAAAQSAAADAPPEPVDPVDPPAEPPVEAAEPPAQDDAAPRAEPLSAAEAAAPATRTEHMAEETAALAAEEDDRPKRRGWWSLSRG